MEMETFFTVSEQLKIFAISCVGGAFIGIIYDIFRAIRITVPHGRIAVFIEDCLFFIILGVYLILFAILFSRGQIRMYMVLGSVLGFIIYILSVGRVVIGILLKIKHFIVKIASFIYKPISKISKFIYSKLCIHTKISNSDENIEKNLDLQPQSEV